MSDELTIALAKGRILDETLPLLARAGIKPADDLARSRKLVFATNHDNIKLVLIRSADVATYVQYGAADLGVAGKDVLLEHGGEGLYERLDLKIAPCRLMTAGFVDRPLPRTRLKVATKYPRITRQFFLDQGRQVELIKLYGSIELAPLVGLSERIVDLVSTGATLRDNGMVEVETIAEITTRLIVNRASLKTKHKRIAKIIDDLEQVIGDDVKISG